MRATRETSSTVLRSLGCAVALTLSLGGCGGEGQGPSTSTPAGPTTSSPAAPGAEAPSAEQRFPDVLAVEVRPTGAGTYDLSVTVSSPYDSAERYADGWRVLAPEGTLLGEHRLAHDHANEQPFTRTMTGVTIPAGVDRVTVEGRDRVNGYGGSTLTVDVPRG